MKSRTILSTKCQLGVCGRSSNLLMQEVVCPLCRELKSKRVEVGGHVLLLLMFHAGDPSFASHHTPAIMFAFLLSLTMKKVF